MSNKNPVTPRILSYAIAAVLLPAALAAFAQSTSISQDIEGEVSTEPAHPAAPSPVLPAAQAPVPVPAPTLEVAAAGAELAPDSVLRAQILLERAHFSSGEIDGVSGSNTRRAIAGFQQFEDLEASGKLDAATWEALNRDSAPALIDYTLTAADVAGPFLPIPSDMIAKSKLPALGYTSAEEALGEKFHASPGLLRKLNPGKNLSRAGVRITVPNVAAGGLAKADMVVVDKSDASVALVDAAGKIYARFPATMGSIHDPLPLGEWKIQGVARNPTFHYNPKLFWDGNPAHAKAKIPAGPNNPVGTAWIDLSKEHYGIHGTPEPGRISKTQSHGCIRLTNWSVQLVAQAVAPGMTALLQE